LTNIICGKKVKKIKDLFFYQFRIVSLWMLICFFQTGLFFLSFEKFNLLHLIRLDSVLSISLFFLFFTILALIISNISTVAIWMSAKLLKGQGTYSQTFEAFVWAMIYLTIPFGLSFVFLQYNLPIDYLLRKFFRLVMFSSLIYGFLSMLKSISEFHNLSFFRSFFALLFSVGILFPLILLLMYFSRTFEDFNSSFRYLFILVISISIQLIALFTFIYLPNLKRES
jgi:hypothetical protein